jgi:hypothetical protein
MLTGITPHAPAAYRGHTTTSAQRAIRQAEGCSRVRIAFPVRANVRGGESRKTVFRDRVFSVSSRDDAGAES